MNIKRICGFTIIELMIVIAIAAILATIAVPAVGEFIKNNRIKSEMYNLLNSINQARTEAVKRKETVTICRSNDLDASPSCGGTANTWSTGWLVFEDDNANGDYDAADDIAISTTVGGGGALNVMGNSDYMIYNPDGSRRKDSGGNNVTRFAICDDRGEDNGRQVNITQVGRASLYSYPIDDCDNPTGP